MIIINLGRRREAPDWRLSLFEPPFIRASQYKRSSEKEVGWARGLPIMSSALGIQTLQKDLVHVYTWDRHERSDPRFV